MKCIMFDRFFLNQTNNRTHKNNIKMLLFYILMQMKYFTPLELYHNTTGPLMGLIVGNKQLGLSISDPNRKDESPNM